MDGNLRNMASIYLYDENSNFLMLYRIGSKAIKDSYIGTAGGHFEKEELNNAKACILRELKEELGVTFKPEEAIFLKEVKRERVPQNFKDLWLFKKDINIEDLTFPDGEATEAKWVNIDEFIRMFNNNEIIPTVDFGRKEYEATLEKIFTTNEI